jgi:hypothetical protein
MICQIGGNDSRDLHAVLLSLKVYDRSAARL